MSNYLVSPCIYCHKAIPFTPNQVTIMCPYCRGTMSIRQNGNNLQLFQNSPAISSNRLSPADAFSRVARGKQGLTCVELEDALRLAGICVLPDICNFLMSCYDRDRSGTIDRNEFSEIVNYLNNWITFFNQYDLDKTGKINARELDIFLQKYNLSQDLKRLMFANIDNDHSNTLDLNQFIKLALVLDSITKSFSRYNPQNGRISVTFEDLLRIVFTIPL